MKGSHFAKFVIAAMVIMIVACGKKDIDQTAQSSGDTDSWKEMDDFHMVMAETFHPYKDSADLAPVKQKYGELMAAADKWATSVIPEKVNNDDTKLKLQNLKNECKVLADVVQAGNDDAIGTQLTKVHDLFHEVQESWYAGGHHHHDEAH